MSKNLELKIRVNSFLKIKESLENIGAEFCGELIQKDIYYKITSGLLKLRLENGAGSLIKYLRDEKGKERWSDYQILKIENSAEDFFKDIFQVESAVEKKRLLYLYKNTRVHLDDVKFLGTFLELETVVRQLPDGLNDARERFNEIIDLLDLDIREQIKKSYKLMIMERRDDFN